MPEIDLIKVLRTMVGWDEDVETLSTYLMLAGRKIVARAYPYGQYTEDADGHVVQSFIVPSQYQMLQCEIAAYMLNKRGAEGQVTHSENGISRTYGSDDVPEHLISQVVPYVGV